MSSSDRNLPKNPLPPAGPLNNGKSTDSLRDDNPPKLIGEVVDKLVEQAAAALKAQHANDAVVEKVRSAFGGARIGVKTIHPAENPLEYHVTLSKPYAPEQKAALEQHGLKLVSHDDEDAITVRAALRNLETALDEAAPEPFADDAPPTGDTEPLPSPSDEIAALKAERAALTETSEGALQELSGAIKRLSDLQRELELTRLTLASADKLIDGLREELADQKTITQTQQAIIKLLSAPDPVPQQHKMECEETPDTPPAEYARRLNQGWRAAYQQRDGVKLYVMWVRDVTSLDDQIEAVLAQTKDLDASPEATEAEAEPLDAEPEVVGSAVPVHAKRVSGTIVDVDDPPVNPHGRKDVETVSFAEALASGQYTVDELRQIGDREAKQAGLNVLWQRQQNRAGQTWEGLLHRLPEASTH